MKCPACMCTNSTGVAIQNGRTVFICLNTKCQILFFAGGTILEPRYEPNYNHYVVQVWDTAKEYLIIAATGPEQLRAYYNEYASAFEYEMPDFEECEYHALESRIGVLWDERDGAVSNTVLDLDVIQMMVQCGHCGKEWTVTEPESVTRCTRCHKPVRFSGVSK